MVEFSKDGRLVVESGLNHCPDCGGDIREAASLAGTRSPIEGDFCLCIHCGQVLRFVLTIRPVTLDLAKEVLTPNNFARLMKTRAAIRKL